MTKLDPFEINLLQGTDLIVSMIKNKIKLDLAHVEWLDDFMSINSRGLYYVLLDEPSDHCIVYCEFAADAENIIRIAERGYS